MDVQDSEIDAKQQDEENGEQLRAIANLVTRSRGRFALALIQFDLPRWNAIIRTKLDAAIPDDWHIVTVRLARRPGLSPTANVLDDIRAQARTAQGEPPDVLIITGYESLLPQETEIGTPLDATASRELLRAVQPLNLGRNQLAEMFPCPILLCLPDRAMTTLLQNAPDLITLRSGSFSFKSDLALVHREMEQAAGDPMDWRRKMGLRRMKLEDVDREAQKLEHLVRDAYALPLDSALLANLLERLGWHSLRLGNKEQARATFAKLRGIAEASNDSQLYARAESGMRAAERVRLKVNINPEKARAASQFLTGVAALDMRQPIFGREDELRQLIDRVASVETRFLIVWGQTGSGKSSLVRAGLLPRLRAQGRYLPVLVSRWDKPLDYTRAAVQKALEIMRDDTAVSRSDADREALAKAASLDPFEDESLLDYLLKVTAITDRAVVIVFDQFEQFFELHEDPDVRAPFMDAVGRCYRHMSLPCTFLFIIPEDDLGLMVEFERNANVPEPLMRANRFHLPLFNADSARQVLREMSREGDLGWSDDFLREIVSALLKTGNGRVRPIELQLVASALVTSGIHSLHDLRRNGDVDGLLKAYLDLTLTTVARNRALRDLRKLVELMKRSLLALVGDPPSRIALTAPEIADRTGRSPQVVQDTLELLTQACLLNQRADNRYELMHDRLVEMVLETTRNLLITRRLANVALQRAIEDCKLNPKFTLDPLKYLRIRRYADRTLLKSVVARALLRRSFIASVTYCLLLVGAVFGIPVLLCYTFAHVSIERDARDRVVLTSGPAWLKWLPGYGNTIVFDTGLTYTDLNRKSIPAIANINWFQWDHHLTQIMRDPTVLDAIRSRSQLGTLECETASAFVPVQTNPGMLLLMETSVSSSSDEADDAGVQLGRMAAAYLQVGQLHDKLAQFALGSRDGSLAAALKSRQGDAPASAIRALGHFGCANPALADSVVRLVLPCLNPGQQADDVRAAAAMALGQVMRVSRAKPRRDVIIALKSGLSDPDSAVQSACASALGAIGTVDSDLGPGVIANLCSALNQNDDLHLHVAPPALPARASRSSQNLAYRPRSVASTSIDASRSARASAATALGEIGACDEGVVHSLIAALESQSNIDIRVSAAAALGRIGRANAGLAPRIVEVLWHAYRQRAQDQNIDVCFAISLALGNIGSGQSGVTNTVVSDLLSVLSNRGGDLDVYAAASAGLGRISRSRGWSRVDILTKMNMHIADLRDTLKDEQPQVRLAAAEALGYLISMDRDTVDENFDDLRIALDDQHADVRRSVGEAMCQVIPSKNWKTLYSRWADLSDDEWQALEEPFGHALYNSIKRNSGQQGLEAATLLEAHLQGVKSLADFDQASSAYIAPFGNALTDAHYRNVISFAMAYMLADDDPKLRPGRDSLRNYLVSHAKDERELDLHIAAWEALGRVPEFHAAIQDQTDNP